MPGSRPRLALATSSDEPFLSEDDRLLIPPLTANGIDPHIVVWSDHPDVKGCDGVLIRSAWDYHLRCDEFIAWLRSCEARGIPVWNPSSMVAANADKRYLEKLRKSGISVPESVVVTSPGDTIPPRFLTEPVVVKPVVSGGAYLTYAFERPDPGVVLTAVREVLKHSPAILQEFMPEIGVEGEYSFIYLDGTFSHAVRKRPSQGDFRVQEEHGGTMERFPSLSSFTTQADRVVATEPSAPLYARVDAIPRNGRLVVMELELIEPSLFFAYDSSAADRLARACLRRLNGHA